MRMQFSFRGGPRIFAVPFALLALLLCAGIAQAAPAARAYQAAMPSSSQLIVGPVHSIGSPQAFRSPGSHFFDVTHVPLRLLAPAYYVVDGQLIGGHYEYAYDLHAPRGKVVAAIEVALNPVAHTELIEVGISSESVSQAPAQAPEAQGSSAASQVAIQYRGAAAAPQPFLSSTSGFYRTVWSAPLGSEVNEVKDTINFTYDGTYVDSFGGSDYRWWATAIGLGWSEQSHSIGSYYSNNYSQGTVWTYDHFYSGSYCWPLGGSDVYYSDNNVYGFSSGSVGGHVSTHQDGNCSGTLSYYTQVGGGA